MWAQEYNESNDKTTSMNTLTACVNKAVKQGFTDSFKIRNNSLYSQAKDKSYTPEQVVVKNFYRFEGESDPADNSIMYVIETVDGVKGILVDAYGAYSDEATTKFMKKVEEMNKKLNGNSTEDEQSV